MLVARADFRDEPVTEGDDKLTPTQANVAAFCATSTPQSPGQTWNLAVTSGRNRAVPGACNAGDRPA